MSEERPSLLIVDDERGPAESLRMIFKRSYNVFPASGGPQALEILRSTPIDVVTLDLRMPVMSGVEVMERIKTMDPDVEVIVVTGYSSLDSAIRGCGMACSTTSPSPLTFRRFRTSLVERWPAGG